MWTSSRKNNSSLMERENHPHNSINGVSRVAVTSTVLCVLIWLLDIIILALSYSEFCKQSSNYEIDVKKKGSAFRTENKISMNGITRSCFVTVQH
ncbi:unnamed protein product [Oikopleura dioica]|uniref:Uncharacterized protein n=1 Tax=Oikopleura dioica TaxID=34765 RepID=E4YHB6_OIKDI|nr:unnamed protein product [Oikopleura dioica]